MKQLPQHLVYITPRTCLLTFDVIYLESNRNYTFVYFTNGKRMLLSKTMSVIFAALPSGQFLRISRTHVINLHYFRGINHTNETPVALVGKGLQLPVSRRRLKILNFSA
ncbi:LytR/AlgR family response regulator transcription factor [Runella salmonicolor]|uniref:LytTR family transcriptional regulator n=1 Tax=Runella salmonicolor TaxID=2950278 RepID=A0ABT1FWV9_9BACT|nr:LytTR family DNA-binding domain-containing protein [Runella salmonicolor]MCP1386239.1 LytTR family transcriptional regulator [Runella salmonicolor]